MASRRNVAALRGLLLMSLLALVMGSWCIPLPPTPSDVILDEADRRAKQLDQDAFIVRASGVNGASFDGTGSKTLSYAFTAVDPTSTSGAWELTYDLSTWKTRTLLFPPVGIAYYDLLNVTMTEADARELLADAGFPDTFLSWTLSKVLTAEATDPAYTFAYSDKSVSINTRTKVITVVVFDTDAVALTAATGPGEDSASLEKIAAADAEIKNTDPEAFIIWAGGRNGDGTPLQAPGETNLWNFHAVKIAEGNVQAWWMTYDGAQFTIEPMALPPMGIQFLDLTTVQMDVVQAWSLAVDAGYQPPFDWWVLFKDLNPSIRNPEYVFLDDGAYVFVDTVTGEVSQGRQ